MNTSDFKIGDRVAYCPHITDEPVQYGVVTSINDRYVFVLFDRQHIREHGKACIPDDLAKLLNEHN